MYGHAGFQIVGTCSQDVEVTKLTSGTKRATISLVVNTPEKQQDGTYKERATWIRVAVFGDRAESKSVLRCKKGVAVFVSGNIQSYQQEIDGKKWTLHNFRPDVIRPLDPKPKEGGGESDDDFPGEYDGPETR